MSESVSYETLLSGFSQAVDRFENARTGLEETATFFPLFESLNWAVALDDHVGEYWQPEGERMGLDWRDKLDDEGSAVVQGVRFVRNRVHHQWAKAIRCDTGGAQFPLVFPLVFHEWCWLPAESLPTSNKRRGIDQYGVHLKGSPVRLTLTTLARVYRSVFEDQSE